MKNIVFTFIIALFSGLITAQVTQDFESGDRNAIRANCWQMWGTSPHQSASINGSYGARSSALSNQGQTAEVISPWITVTQNTQASFKYSKSNNSTSNVQLRVVAISTDGSETTVWGPQPVNPGDQNGTFNITLNGDFQFKYEFLTGGGGATRGHLDDIIIPGIYVADPSQNPNGVGNCVLAGAIQDSDGDGVADEDDAYPNDATKAYDNVFPGESSLNTLAFEDLWPSQGDYDFNDLVVDYRFNEITNADNEVVEINATLKVRAVGGSQNNGFAIQLDNVNPSDIASVSGQVLTGSLFSVAGNGTENGQTNAVIPVFDSAENVINRDGNGSFFNTIPGTGGTGTSDVINLVITFSSPQQSIGNAPYNPFLIKNQQRGAEIHLADKQPTALADASLFGTGEDDSSVNAGRYYKTSNNLPWALDINGTFDYPVEGVDIIQAYLNLAEWALSNGEFFTDWYSNNNSSYRDNSKIYILK
jgi:LruC domain-containing protein